MRRIYRSRLRESERPAAIAAVLLVCLSAVSCSSQQPRIPPLNTEALTTVLERGVSTMVDVRAALGEPNGSGAALIPTAVGRRTVWFYERVTVDLVGAGSGTEAGGSEIHQEVLMVFFDEERFDGFLWFSSEQ